MDNEANPQPIRGEILDMPAPLEAVLLPVTDFPVPQPELAPLRQALNALTAELLRGAKLSSEVFLQFTQLHVDDAADRLSQHGVEWMPEIGMGVWPGRPGPTLWTRDDFMNLEVGQMPRRVMHQVFRITAPAAARRTVLALMLGYGAYLEMLTPDDWLALMKKSSQLLKPVVTDPSFSCYPFFTPLLERKSIEGKTAAEIQTLLCGSRAYIRESAEDKGILVIAEGGLRRAAQAAGIELSTNGHEREGNNG